MSNTPSAKFKERLINLARQEANELAPHKEALKAAKAEYAELRRGIMQEMKKAEELDTNDIAGIKFAVRVERLLEVNRETNPESHAMAMVQLSLFDARD